MGRVKQFAHNSFWLTAATTAALLTGFVYNPIIGRMLGVLAYGQYSFITVFVSYFGIVAYFGMKQVATREIGRDQSTARVFLLTCYKLRAITTIIAIAASCVIGYALNRGQAVTAGIFIMSLSVAVTGVGELIEGALIALARCFYLFISYFVGNILKLIIGIWALKAGYGLIGVLWVFLITSAIMTLLNMYFLKLTFRSVEQHESKLVNKKFIFSESVPFFLTSVSTRLYTKSDVLFLGMLKGMSVTGIYSAAYMFLTFLLIVSNSVTTAAYPVIARLYAHEDKDGNKVDLAEAYERLHKYMIISFIPICVLLMIFAGDILPRVYNKNYIGGVPTMQVLIWTPLTDLSACISGTFISAIYRQKLNAVLSTVGMAINISWTIGFILLYGAMGAAIATLGSAVVNATIHQYYIFRTIGTVNLTNIWVKPIICGIIMIAVMLLLSHQLWAFRLLAGIFSYAAAIVIIRPYDDEDLRLLKSIVKH